jgi:hypothetical protein
VDELDLGWDGSEDAKAFVAGLFQACHAINRLSPGRIRVYVSLRQELYSSIPAIYQDAQKYRDLFELITWTTEDLRTLIASRIRHFVPALRHETDDTCWRTVFNDTRAFKYMIDRSLHRPRELILFATYALDHARARGALGAMSIQDLLLTETDYSRERANDIVAEYQFEYPGLDSVLTWFQGRALWERDRLEMLCLELVVGEKAVSDLAATWVHSSDPERVIEALWRVGFLQAEMEAGARASGVMRTVGSHEDPNHNVAASVQFRVHPMFHAYLGIPSPVQV